MRFWAKRNVLLTFCLVPVLMFGITGCVTETTGGFQANASSKRAVEQYVDVAIAYLQEGDFDLATRRLERAFEIDSEHPRAHAVFGLIYQAQLEPQKAEESFRKSLSYDPDFSLGRTYYAAFLYQEGRLKECLTQLQKASEDIAFPNRAQVFANIGQVQKRLGNTDEAIKAYERSINLMRAQPEAYLALADLYLQRQEYEKASRYYYVFWDRVRSRQAAHSPSSLYTGVAIARALGDKNKEASLLLYMESEFSDSPEYRELTREK